MSAILIEPNQKNIHLLSANANNDNTKIINQTSHHILVNSKGSIKFGATKRLKLNDLHLF